MKRNHFMSGLALAISALSTGPNAGQLAQLRKTAHSGNSKTRPSRAGYLNTSKYMPHSGPQEEARRRRQMVKAELKAVKAGISKALA